MDMTNEELYEYYCDEEIDNFYDDDEAATSD